MKRHKLAWLLAAGMASLLVAGCGGNEPNYGAPAAVTPPFIPGAGIAPPRFAYVVNSVTNNVSGFTVDPASGALTPITSSLSNSPWATGTTPTFMAVDIGVQFAYVVNSGSDNISVFTIAASGALTATGVGPLTATGPAPKGVAVDPLGRYVYVVNSGDSTVSGYARSSSTGLLTPLSPATVPTGGINSSSITIDPTGKFVYVANFGTGANTGNGSVSVFTIDTSSGTAGQLIPVGSPVTANVTAPSSIAVSPSGAYAYVTNFGGDNVSIFNIDPTTGALNFKTVVASPPAAGTSPTSVAVEPNGKFAYVSSIDLPSVGNVAAFSISQSSGALGGTLTALSGAGAVSTLSSSGGLPYAVSADPSGMYVYVAQSSGGVINPFKIGTTGTLTALTEVSAQPGTDGAIFILITK